MVYTQVSTLVKLMLISMAWRGPPSKIHLSVHLTLKSRTPGPRKNSTITFWPTVKTYAVSSNTIS